MQINHQRSALLLSLSLSLFSFMFPLDHFAVMSNRITFKNLREKPRYWFRAVHFCLESQTLCLNTDTRSRHTWLYMPFFTGPIYHFRSSVAVMRLTRQHGEKHTHFPFLQKLLFFFCSFAPFVELNRAAHRCVDRPHPALCLE